LSKQVIVSETEEAIEYLRLKYGEMLEMLARYSVRRFEGTRYEGCSLERKVEMIGKML
jgi:hypothetical protein